jgi:CheY-like chemotaxis protein
MTAEASEKKKILVVDDEQDVCLYLTRLFQEKGYAVARAADGNEAMRQVELARPDLITLDLSMPNKSGVRFYREIRSRAELRGIPVVFVTAVTGFGGDAQATERFYASQRQVPPPDGFVAKPVDPGEMMGLVERLLGPRAAGA